MYIRLFLILIFTTIALSNENLNVYQRDTEGLFRNSHRYHETAEGIWIASHSGMILFYNDDFKEKHFNSNDYKIYTAATTDLLSDTISNLSKIDDSEFFIYYGSDKSKFTRYRDGFFTHFDTSDIGMTAYVKQKGIGEDRWCSTNYGTGIIKFDGENWIHYDTSNSGMHSNKFYNFFADSHGNLWLNHNIISPKKRSAISRFDGEMWYVYDSSSVEFSSTIVERITEDVNGNVWFGCDEGLTRFDGINFHVYNEETSSIVPNAGHDFISCLSNGDVYIPSPGVGTLLWRNSKFELIENMEWPSLYADHCSVDENDNIWFKSYLDKKWRYGLWDKTNFIMWDTCSWWDSYINEIDAMSEFARPFWFLGLKPNWNVITKAHDDREWENAFFHITPEGYTKYAHYNTGLADDTIRSIVSHDSLLYIAHNYGLTYYNTNDSSWDCWRVEDFEEKGKFLIDSITPLALDSSGTVWCGSSGYGDSIPLAKFDGKMWSFVDSSIIPSSEINDIETAPNGDVWIGHSQGISVFANGEWKSYDQSNSFPSYGVKDIAFSKEGTAWIATSKGVVSGTIGDFENHSKESSPFSTNSFSSVAVDTAGKVWCGTYLYGIYRFSDGEWENISSTEEPLVPERINKITTDSFGNSWFATEKGVLKWNGSEWSIINSDNSDLQSDMISSIAIGRDGSKWIGTEMNGFAHLVDEDKVSLIGSVIAAGNLRSGVKVSGGNIQLTLTNRSAAKLDIYDLRGRLLVHRNLGELDAGVHNIPTGKDLARGCYIARVSAGELVQAVRVVR